MVSHNQLWISMIDMGFPPHMVDLIRSLYRKQQSAVSCQVSSRNDTDRMFQDRKRCETRLHCHLAYFIIIIIMKAKIIVTLYIKKCYRGTLHS